MRRPTLWHVPLSHYSEKARWALDYKRVPHARRAVLGGLHPLVTFIVTRGRHQTVPALTLDGRGIGDSSAIIAELERRFPDPPLYPREPDGLRRALELEEFFDEEVGPYLRRLAYHEIIGSREALEELTFKQVPTVRRAWLKPTMRGVALFLDARFSIRSADKAREAEAKVMAGLERLERELDGNEFLVGDTFTVADLTAAALLYGLVLPPEGPWHPANIPEPWRRRTEALRDRPAFRWIEQTYARHRAPATAAA